MRTSLDIAVGIDSEEASRLAVDWVIRLAERVATKITLVTVFESLLRDPADDSVILEAERVRILSALPGVIVDTAHAHGSIPEGLLRFASRADLLVIGAHRQRHWQSVLTGDLPAHMTVISDCPVVVVPDDWRPRRGRVLVGLDEDGSSEAALLRAARFADAFGAELQILHAWVPTPAFDVNGVYLRTAADPADRHRAHLASAVRRVRGVYPDLDIRPDLYEGAIATGLLAASAHAELVVVGSHRRGLISGLLLGSTARDLLRESSTPVCVVSPPKTVTHGESAEVEEAWA